MNQSDKFLYTLDNLGLFSSTLITSIMLLLLGIVIMGGIRAILYYIAGVSLMIQDRRVLDEKKQILSDLILMKEIQTELEKEIEQAALKATFQNGL